MEALLRLADPPTAVYAHSDEVALGAMRTIRRSGMTVPHDMSIIGIDDHPLAGLTDLTTARQPVPEQGVAGAEVALCLLGGKQLGRRGITVPNRAFGGPPGRLRCAPDSGDRGS